MASLCPGVQYGLSSQQNFGENKDLVFVKLTDSALRAIEDYIKNKNKFNCQTPTIKFLGNEGQLSLPSVHNGNTSFSFSMSSTADMEGPGGSFECVQQMGPHRNSLEVLGSIPYKVRIHANDDIYEATRQRVTVAEENHKNKCTREIKPNQTDIGRKVKLKKPRASPLPPTRRETPPIRESLSKPSYQSNVPSKPIVNSSSSNNNNNNNNGLVNGNIGNNNYLSSSRSQLNKPSTPDIARRPVKERLIHLLALKPFKKVELYERLTREGLREKNSMSSVLKQISKLKDNCFHLNRAMWNEVHEDWPFYTESERQVLKRRKPQNLTPPGSSDGGSSGSGQSPTSTHPGSPPPISSSSSSSKRPGYYDSSDIIPTKKPRISHYHKPPEPQIYRPPVENNSQRRPITDSRDASNMNPRSRESPTTNGYPQPPPPPLPTITTNSPAGSFTNGYNINGMLNENNKRNFSDDEDNANRKRSCDNNSLSFGVIREKTFIGDNNNRSLSPANINNKIQQDDSRKDLLTDVVVNNNNNNKKKNGFCNGITTLNGKYNNNNNNKQHELRMKDRDMMYDKISSINNHQNRIPRRISPNSQSEQISDVDVDQPLQSSGKNNILDNNSEFPDYLTEYTTIKDAEQRRRYKADFNADYAEYRDLHGAVERVSRRFAELEERLKQEDIKSPRYKDIKKQIFREYQENKNDKEHQKSKLRFQYLHEKLSHIKRLVLEYDQGVIDNQY